MFSCTNRFFRHFISMYSISLPNEGVFDCRKVQLVKQNTKIVQQWENKTKIIGTVRHWVNCSSIRNCLSGECVASDAMWNQFGYNVGQYVVCVCLCMRVGLKLVYLTYNRLHLSIDQNRRRTLHLFYGHGPWVASIQCGQKIWNSFSFRFLQKKKSARPSEFSKSCRRKHCPHVISNYPI